MDSTPTPAAQPEAETPTAEPADVPAVVPEVTPEPGLTTPPITIPESGLTPPPITTPDPGLTPPPVTTPEPGTMPPPVTTPEPGTMPPPAITPEPPVLPDASAVPTRENSGLLTIYVPYDAKVTINDLLTHSKGSRRRYVSYGLQPGFSYKYEVRAEIVRDGRRVEEKRTVVLAAGDHQTVAFGFNPNLAEGLAAR